MDILVPKNLFLRVADKFVPGFIDNDKAVRMSPSLLYKKLFAECAETGSCTLPQKYLAEQCKLSIRCLQYAQKRLKDLGYIHINHVAGECSTYVLLLSDRIKNFLTSSDLIDRSSWYPRSSPNPLSQTGSSSANAANPPQNLQDGCAKFAHPSYNEEKNEKNQNTLPTSPPVISKVTPPDAPGGENFSSPDFESLWASWPVKQDKLTAFKAFARLQRGRRLPAMPTLLALVEKFRTSDRRWLKGFAPNLSNWLRGERWNDDILVASDSDNIDSSSSTDHAAKPSAFPVITFAPTFVAELPPDLAEAAETLCHIWPDQPARTPIKALFRTRVASGGFNVEVMLRNARTYLRDSQKPVGLLRWLRESLGELHEKNETAGIRQGRISCDQGRGLCAA